MRKTLLPILALQIAFSASAQVPSTNQGVTLVKIDPAIANKAVAYDKQFYTAEENVVPFSKVKQYNKTVGANGVKYTPYSEAVVGTTKYDLQTNSTVYRRLLNNGDGTFSAVWTMATGTYPSFTERGTGYNYYDGTAWGTAPTVRLESIRCGFPSIGVLGNGKEVIVSHQAIATNPENDLQISHRAAKGTGAWTEDQTVLGNSPIAKGNLWPQMAVGGANGTTLHVISVTTPTGNEGAKHNGMDGALLYCRSLDGGATFDKDYIQIPGMDSSSYLGFNGDSYTIDAKGDTVVIVFGGFTKEVAIFKSIDNGENWTKTVVGSFPIPKWETGSGGKSSDIDNDGQADTLTTCDGSVAVLIDNAGKTHVWYGRMRVLCTTPGTAAGEGLTYFPATDGIVYWNDGMLVDAGVVIAGILDLNLDGSITLPTNPNGFAFGRYTQSLTSFPSAGIDAQGNIFLSYSSIVEGTDDGQGKAYRHVFVMRSDDGGQTWTNGAPAASSIPLDVVNDAFSEGVFASMARKVDDNIHLIYQRDPFPGYAYYSSAGTPPDPDNDGTYENEIVYVSIPKDNLKQVGVKENNKVNANIAIYPNPASDITKIAINSKDKGDVNITVYDLLGHQLSSVTSKINPGINQVILNLDNYKAGIYFINATFSNGHKLTQKLVVE